MRQLVNDWPAEDTQRDVDHLQVLGACARVDGARTRPNVDHLWRLPGPFEMCAFCWNVLLDSAKFVEDDGARAGVDWWW